MLDEGDRIRFVERNLQIGQHIFQRMRVQRRGLGNGVVDAVSFLMTHSIIARRHVCPSMT